MNDERFLGPCVGLALGLLVSWQAALGEVHELNGQRFELPSGFSIELVAGPPLVDRPICADFDEEGRLYVADSSGSNASLEEQLKERPHRIVRLADTDGDGVFDESTVFADRMMFPEGAEWHDGSLYVAAPPSIWKLTDTTGDGIADKREEWFQAGTLTHCGNDLHGPYLGPDGYLYWCKGAWAEQTYDRPGEEPFVTQAAHIFRCRPDAPRDPETGSVLTSAIEPVMTGGMDNPVEVAFTPGGERIFTTTFLVNPGGGLRDGLIHAIYGGVYGKPKMDALAGHPRTGELMPVLQHFGAAAPCGLTRYQSAVFGAEYQDNLFACLFNMRKVTRHVLKSEGAGLVVTNHDDSPLTANLAAPETFLESDHVDFHPTDVLEDADGSLLVIDTGGWYKLCCPTSQLEKPDVLGAIYRVRRVGAKPLEDPRGRKIEWPQVSIDQLLELLSDNRPAVRQRAVERLGDMAEETSGARDAFRRLFAVQDASSAGQRLQAVWALSRIDTKWARTAVRNALGDSDETIRQAAAHVVSVWRDRDAVDELCVLLESDSLANRRAAAEALGRLGDERAVGPLLNAASSATGRTLQHSLTYALIQIGDPQATRAELTMAGPQARAIALLALDQMEGGRIEAKEVLALLAPSADKAAAAKPVSFLTPAPEGIRRNVLWLLDNHPEWGAELTNYFARSLHVLVERLRTGDPIDEGEIAAFQQHLATFLYSPTIGELLRDVVANAGSPAAMRTILLEAARKASWQELPTGWAATLANLLHSSSEEQSEQQHTVISSILETIGSVELTAADWQALQKPLTELAEDAAFDPLNRTRAVEILLRRGEKRLSPEAFALLLEQISSDRPALLRAAATRVLGAASLTGDQIDAIVDRLASVSPLDINAVVQAVARSGSAATLTSMLQKLATVPARSALREEPLRELFASGPKPVSDALDELVAQLQRENADQLGRLNELLADLPAGDVRRGQAVFRSSKTACASCHEIGYLGGQIGPDLTNIGRTRTRRDLLESIVFPSASLVRSYEPVTVETVFGTSHSGLVQSDTPEELVLTLGVDQRTRIRKNDIEAITESHQSIMPSGLDQQMSHQDLADLLEFLLNAR